MIKALVIISFVLMLFQITQAQEIAKKDSSPIVFYDKFDAPSKHWTSLATEDNYLKIDSGIYLMNRKNLTMPYASMLTGVSEMNDYIIKTSLKFLKPEKDQTIGIIFMVQKSGKDAFIFEINNRHEYRVKQIDKGFYIFVSGNKDDFGWVKTKVLKDNEYNTLEARITGGKAYLYINNEYLTMAFDDAYHAGAMGFLIGQSTKAAADYFMITSENSKKEPIIVTTKITKEPEKVIPLIKDTVATIAKIQLVKTDTLQAVSPVIKTSKSIEISIVDSLKMVIANQSRIINSLESAKKVPEPNGSSSDINKQYQTLYLAYDSLRFQMAKLLVNQSKLEKTGSQGESTTANQTNTLAQSQNSQTGYKNQNNGLSQDSIKLLFKLINDLNEKITYVDKKMVRVEDRVYKELKAVKEKSEGIKEKSEGNIKEETPAKE